MVKSLIIFFVCLYFLFSLLNNPIPVWPAKEGGIHITPSQAKVGEGKILSYNFKIFQLANIHRVQTKKRGKLNYNKIALRATGKRLRCQYWDHKIEGKDMC